jgi:hypothetical protein
MQLNNSRRDMSETQDVRHQAKVSELLADYIPPQDTWNPADEALYQPADPYRVSLEEAQDMQLKAIKFTFTRHYRNNDFYHRYCEMRDITPDDIKTNNNLDKIPLIPDIVFKQHPSGKDLAYWIVGIFTGDLPKIVVEGANPTFDDIVNAFNTKGLAVMYTSGTSGRFSVIPRDMKTFRAAEYALAKSRASMVAQTDDHVLLLFPNPARTNLFIGRVSSLSYDLFGDVHYAVDSAITAEVTQKAMSGNERLSGRMPSSVQSETQQKIVDKTVQWLERYEKTEESIRLGGPPFMLVLVMNALQKDGKRFDFGERGNVLTAGGWKIHENARFPHADFRKQVQNVLGIPEARCLDLYGLCESNGFMMQCPEGHYLHAPYTYLKPLVLDDALMPVGYGEWGHFAFLDALAQSYPGFIISGDLVRLLERCPVCDRPGPVFEPEVHRAKGEEVRGCAEQLRRILSQDLVE